MHSTAANVVDYFTTKMSSAVSSLLISLTHSVTGKLFHTRRSDDNNYCITQNSHLSLVSRSSADVRCHWLADALMTIPYKYRYLRTMSTVFNLICCWNGSQWSSRSELASVMRRAVMFWIDCSNWSLTPAYSWLQWFSLIQCCDFIGCRFPGDAYLKFRLAVVSGI